MRLVNKVTIVLAILAAFSAGSIASSAMNYMQGMSATRNVQLELSSLELRDDGNPEVFITFHLENRSPINMKVKTFHFGLYLNENFIGSNYAPFAERNLAGFEETRMDFVIPVRPVFLQYIKRARQEEGFSWFVRGKAKLLLPFKGKEFWLNVREHWSGY